ncbi:Global transcription regulator sge1 [Exophiala xenobiotica]|nr:Global transcription regulator sge1 [Exophiala xenobiotica]KAK5332514.1 Global transcription regulator sge1 [Exophiala xenobiotica]
MQSDIDIQPSYFGFVDTHDDAVMLIQACVRGSLQVIQRRPTSSERPSVAQSGHVFIYEERASGIQRWTDGGHWSPSRVFGEFLIYGERSAAQNQSHITETDKLPLLVKDGLDDGHQRLCGPLAKFSYFDPESLVKKTITVASNDHSGAIWHLVSYYRPVDVLQGRLQTPTMNQDLILQPCHLPRNSIPYGNSYDGHRAGESSISPTRHLWASSHHAQPDWPMLKESDRYHTNADRDPFSESGIFDNGAMPWSIDGTLDPSLFGYGICSADGSFIW